MQKIKSLKSVLEKEYVFLLQHVSRKGSADEDVKVIGIFKNLGSAKSCIARLKKLEGFNIRSGEFFVDRYALGEQHWDGGFATVSVKENRSRELKRTPRKPIKAR